ncbi:ester cyclase [Pyxidicoccus parkwayensis]|uniref:Ester cyclase n=1 Tax=Pyxidicoccus parkwayensis TaxID=2813578 RepID=A0ABX7NXY8_9BACT|nr:ester cyclase [Pyxidicoccus parkwaysis]QSQ23757.1 ester cyclase [Pyxidicoccus parkwaysis]
MATRDNATVVKDFYRAFNEKNLELIQELAHPDAIVQSIPFDETVGFLDHCESWATAMPDGQVDLTSLIVQGDRVVVEFTGRGTHAGPFKGPGGVMIPASNRVGELRFVEIFELRDGKIAEMRQYYDALSLMTQFGIGAQPGMGREVEAPVPEARH